MKYLIFPVLLVVLFSSCKNQNSAIVSKLYVDSLVSRYKVPQTAIDNGKDMLFWKNRINPKNPGQVSEAQYASTLTTRFYEFGDIQDIKQAENVQKSINKTYNNHLSSPFASLAHLAMMQHRFMQADTFYEKAKMIGMETNSEYALNFDVNFELGRYTQAFFALKRLQRHKDYNYYFRRSKYDHLQGGIDSAISGMLAAANLAKTAPYLQGVALSNAGDLYIHGGDLDKAAALYKQCIRLNPIDFHSILGLGWIALVHDKNDTLAEKIFKFVQSKNKLPDATFKLYQMAQGRGDAALETTYARQFANKATDTVYGRMYNKYLIEIYTGILNEPAKAEALAKDELNSRATPATYAWYAYTLFKNKKNAEAYKVFEQHVSGQPLEGLELYYMGKLMAGLNKGYNATEFFKAADRNKYDLSPDMAKDLAKNLEE